MKRTILILAAIAAAISIQAQIYHDYRAFDLIGPVKSCITTKSKSYIAKAFSNSRYEFSKEGKLTLVPDSLSFRAAYDENNNLIAVEKTMPVDAVQELFMEALSINSPKERIETTVYGYKHGLLSVIETPGSKHELIRDSKGFVTEEIVKDNDAEQHETKIKHEVLETDEEGNWTICRIGGQTLYREIKYWEPNFSSIYYNFPEQFKFEDLYDSYGILKSKSLSYKAFISNYKISYFDRERKQSFIYRLDYIPTDFGCEVSSIEYFWDKYNQEIEGLKFEICIENERQLRYNIEYKELVKRYKKLTEHILTIFKEKGAEISQLKGAKYAKYHEIKINGKEIKMYISDRTNPIYIETTL